MPVQKNKVVVKECTAVYGTVVFGSGVQQLSLLACTVFCRQVSAGDVGPIGAFIRANVVGQPVIHEKQTWIFDPDVSLRRRKQFVQLNGDKGEKLIERLGLGVDGYDDERLEMQRERDEGHLGGLNAFLP